MSRGGLDWHLITPEYPPGGGGVAGFSRRVAEGLARRLGTEVHVWTPARAPDAAARPSRVVVHPTLGSFRRRDFRATERELERTPPGRRLFVQWVPHGYGYRSLNLALPLFLRRRARRGDRIELMAHEPFLAFGEGRLRQDFAAAVHRVMAALALRASARIWTSTPAWEPLLRAWAGRPAPPFAWLPIPSTVEPVADLRAVRELRREIAGARPILGHFGTYGAETCDDLTYLLLPLLARDDGPLVLLLGDGGRELAATLRRAIPGSAERLRAPGRLDETALSTHLAACDLLVQPFPDGASGRRTSLMAGLAHGVATVTSDGRFTEPCWRDGAVELAPALDLDRHFDAVMQLLGDDERRRRIGEAGRALYCRSFSLARALERLDDDGNRPQAGS